MSKNIFITPPPNATQRVSNPPTDQSINQGRRLHNNRHTNGLKTLTHALNTHYSLFLSHLCQPNDRLDKTGAGTKLENVWGQFCNHPSKVGSVWVADPTSAIGFK